MIQDLITALRPTLVMSLLLALLLGIAYPLTMLAVGQTIFPHQANGSLIAENGRVIGSELIGQGFASDRYFHGRPSAAGKGYDPTASSGSNLGPTSQALADRVKGDVAVLGKNVPVDLVTASGSGLDPDISPAAAYWQIDRVARVRKLDPALLHRLVASEAKTPILGLLGEPRVNVLALNRRLDAEMNDRSN